MPPSAPTESHIAAQSSTPSSKHSAPAAHPDHDDSSDAETEPLPYDDAEHDDRHSDTVMDPNELAHHAASAADTDADAPGEVADVSMEHSADHRHAADHPDAAHADDLGDHDAEGEHSDEDEDDEDALPASQLTNTQDPNSNMSSPQKSAGFTGDDLDDESELTDEEEDQNEEEDNSSLSDDDLGGSDDEDEEEDDDDDQEGKTHEDEAAEALAALTGGAETGDDATAAAGLDALAALDRKSVV